MPSYEMDSLTFADSSKLVNRQQQEMERFLLSSNNNVPNPDTKQPFEQLSTWVLSLCVH
jgi:hypothetical protein